MRKKSNHRPRPCRVPTMVALTVCPEVGIQERLSVAAIAQGWAGVWHFNVLSDCCDLLKIGAADYDDAEGVADLAAVALLNIKDRYQECGKLRATGDELEALRLLADSSEEFWRRQGGTRFAESNRVLDKVRAEQLT